MIDIYNKSMGDTAYVLKPSGLRYMKEGGKGRFLLPSAPVYGQAGIWQILPGYNPVLFEVELISV